MQYALASCFFACASLSTNRCTSVSFFSRTSSLPLPLDDIQNHGAPLQSAGNDIEPYVGPIGSMSDMEGGVVVGELALQVLVAPSLVAPGKGLFLCIYDDIDDDGDNADEIGAVEEIIIPQGMWRKSKLEDVAQVHCFTILGFMMLVYICLIANTTIHSKELRYVGMQEVILRTKWMGIKV